MHISFEGKVAIGISLVLGLVACAMTVWSTHLIIGWTGMVLCMSGLIALAIYHFGGYGQEQGAHVAEGVRRSIATDAESYDASPDDHYLTLRRARQSNFRIKLPPVPKVNKEIEIKLGSNDKTLTVTIDGNGHPIDGRPDDWMNGAGTLRGYRFSGLEWEIF
ncbi:MAG: hypothetical protein ABSA49_15465 [Rhizomicrobium sp.]|jgi:hypothetical protein